MIVLGFDTETKGLEWYADETAFLISWADDRGAFVCSVNDPIGVAAFIDAVKRADVCVAHNLAFDVHQLRVSCGIDMLKIAKDLVDTDTLSRVALPERAWMGGDEGGYKLKNLATTYLRADAKHAEETIEALAKTIGLGTLRQSGAYYEVWRAYPAEMEAYALLDAEYARDLYPILLAKLTPRQMLCWEMEKLVTPVLLRSEARGVRVDPAVVKQLRSEYEPLEASARELVFKTLPEGINLASHPQLREALLELGVPLHRKTPAGELSTAAFALAEFEDQFPVLKALADWRQADKMLGTYIGPMSGREIVHTSFWQIGAKTGRMSCSRPNMQNLPARSEAGDTKLREVFVPRPGYCFGVLDFDAIEVRLLAHYLNSPEYTQLIEDGLDPHAWMAAQVYGGTAEDYAKGGPNDKVRSECKNVLFAIIYGAGANRVSDMLGIEKAEARELINRIKKALPRYFDLKSRVDKKIRATGFVTTILGRKACVSKDKSYVGVNALIQGSAADLFKKAVLDVDEAIRSYGAEIVLYVHDEIVVEMPIDVADEVLAVAKAAMENSHDLRPALLVTAGVAHNNYAEGK